MFYVQCPYCGTPIEVPDNAVGTNRTDPWNVIECFECDRVFDFDDEEIQVQTTESEPS